ncbi:MAG TPA: tol-pal system protein YbgF [Steroidobacteraceae bacterium]|jgi:tol-pal system protein YbgF|nr:tol-pal system protein YbgF [Steroidobacteraceae bacterium]
MLLYRSARWSPRWGLLAAALLVTQFAGCASTPGPDDPVTIKLNDLDRRLERIERVISNQSLLELSQQLQALQTEVRTLRGSLEELQFQNGNAKTQQRDLYADLDRRMKALEAGTAAVGATEAAGAGAGSALLVPAGSDRANYQAAFDLLKAGDYEKATAAFKQFLVAFPQSALADNAQYWLGESYYVTRNYPEALKTFRVVVDRYKESRKLPDAWLKIGYCQYELKNWNAARDALTRVGKDFPDSGAAPEAAKRLQKMKDEGH